MLARIFDLTDSFFARNPAVRKAACEVLEQRRLFSDGPATPSLSAEAIDADTIRLTYSIADGSPLQLEIDGPTDDNFRTSGLTLNSTSGSHTTDLDGLIPDTAYVYRLRATKDGQIAYASSSAITARVPLAAENRPPTPTIQTVTPSEGESGIYNITFEGVYDPDNPNRYLGWVNFTSHTDDPYGLTSHMSWSDPGFYDQSDGLYHVYCGTWDAGIKLGVSVSIYDTELDIWSSSSTPRIVDGPPGERLSAPELSSSTLPDGKIRLAWVLPTGLDPSREYSTRLIRVDANTSTTAMVLGTYDTSTSIIVDPGPAGSRFVAALTSDELSSPYSNFVNADGTLPALPATPTGLQITSFWSEAGMDARLIWDNSANNENSYVVERSSDGTIWSHLTTVGADESSHVDSINDYTIYSYRIKSRNAAGDSQPTLLKERPWPLNGIAMNHTNESVQVKFDSGWQTLQANASTGQTDDCDFIYFGGSMYKIGAARVFIRYTDDTNTTRGVFTRWVDIDSNIYYEPVNPMAANDPNRPTPP